MCAAAAGLAALACAAAGEASGQALYERSGAAIVIFIVSPSQPDIQPFQELAPGRTVALGRDGTMELGYFASCMMESIAGGEVTIGEAESLVRGGAVRREKVDCANMRFRHGVAQLQFAAAAVFEKALAETDEDDGSGAITGDDSDVVSWSGGGLTVPDQLDTLVSPLFAELDGPHRVAVLPVKPVGGTATAEAAAGARSYLIAKIRAESPHTLIAGDQLTGLAMLPGDEMDDAMRRRLRAAGAEVAVMCGLENDAGETTLGCQAQRVDEDVVVGHGAVLLTAAPESDGGGSAIVE